jgi:hypothetical protein
MSAPNIGLISPQPGQLLAWPQGSRDRPANWIIQSLGRANLRHKSNIKAMTLARMTSEASIPLFHWLGFPSDNHSFFGIKTSLLIRLQAKN